ncbi:MAG: polyprenyl synthetase, partial [Salinivirgaceae bacterium]
HVKDKLSASERKKILRLIKKKHKTKKEVWGLINIVEKHGVIDYARKKMEEYKQKALDILDKYPDSAHKNSLKEIVEYTVQRKK